MSYKFDDPAVPAVFYSASQLRAILKCSRSNAYRIIQELNKRRNKIGNLVVDGKLSEWDFLDFLNAGKDLKKLKSEAIMPAKDKGTILLADDSSVIVAMINTLSFDLDRYCVDPSLSSKRERIKKNVSKYAKAVNTKNRLGSSKLKSMPGKPTDKELAGLALALIELGYLVNTYLALAKDNKNVPDATSHELEALKIKADNLLRELMPYNTVE